MPSARASIALICLVAVTYPRAALGQPGSAADNGHVSFSAAADNEIVSLFTRLVVPPEPAPVGTLYLWPGLQPRRGTDYYPIDNGVLQPVLTWGPSPCAAGKQPEEYRRVRAV